MFLNLNINKYENHKCEPLGVSSEEIAVFRNIVAQS